MSNVEGIKNVIAEIQSHYEKHISNKYVKNLLMKVDLPVTINQDKNIVLVNELIYIDSRGALEDLYNGIKAVNYFIKEIDKSVIPNITSYLMTLVTHNENEKILYQMALKNYPMNIQILKDMLRSLFEKVYDFDKINFAKEPAYKRVRNFEELEKIYLMEKSE